MGTDAVVSEVATLVGELARLIGPQPGLRVVRTLHTEACGADPYCDGCLGREDIA